MKSPLEQRSAHILLMALGGAFISGSSTAQTSLLQDLTQKNTDFLEIAYGTTPRGAATSNGFSAHGVDDLRATVQYEASQSIHLEYGVRKAWGLPVDVSASVTQLRTPITGMKLNEISTSIDLSRQSTTNFYLVNVYHDIWTQPRWQVFTGAGLGWVKLVHANTQAATASLMIGTRYKLTPTLYGVMKYKLSTIPKSILINGELEAPINLPRQLMPVLSMGIGMEF